jgi:hypothetical protein
MLDEGTQAQEMNWTSFGIQATRKSRIRTDVLEHDTNLLVNQSEIIIIDKPSVQRRW